MPMDGRAVANFILDFCTSRNRSITNLSLQKIIYFCHVWSLISLERPLIKHNFEAWQFGPVLQYLYREFKDFEGKPITTRAKRLNPDTGTAQVVDYRFDEETEKLLERVVDFYSQMNAGDLVRLSHAPGSPWEQVWNHQGKVNPGMRIENNAIKKYYSTTPLPFSQQ